MAITGRDEAKLRRAADELAGGDRLLYRACDVGDPDQVRSAVEHVTGRWGGIDVLVNNAGTNIKDRGIRQLTPETWKLLIGSNLDGAFYCIHAVLPQMLAQRWGDRQCLVGGGEAGRASGRGRLCGRQVRHERLGMCLAAEEKDSGIRVSNVYPGEVDTPILEVRPTPVSAEQRRESSSRRTWRRRCSSWRRCRRTSPCRSWSSSRRARSMFSRRPPGGAHTYIFRYT